MSKLIKYTGAAPVYAELPATGKPSTWLTSQIERRTDTEADLLLATGQFTQIYLPGQMPGVINVSGPNTLGSVKKATFYQATGNVQWARVNRTTGAITTIAGETGATYTIAQADIGFDVIPLASSIVMQAQGEQARAAAPGVPQTVSVTSGNKTWTLNWSAPASNGGSAITGYEVVMQPYGEVIPLAANVTSYTPARAQNGRYYYPSVRAVNASGPGALSSTFTALPVEVATPATALSLTGPTSATTGTASGAYTVALSPTGGTVAAPVTVTPTAVSGVTFTPASLSLTTASPSGTFTANASTAGTKVIAVTNNGGLTNPAAISLVVEDATVISGSQMFARPAAGLWYQGVMQSVAQGTSNPITSYDCEVAYRANADGTNVFVDVSNICKVNGDVAETFASMNLRVSALINTTNASNGTVQIPLVKDGTAETSVVLTGGQASFGTLSANTTALLNGRNFVVLLRITHEDGTSPINIPLGTAADYGATVLGEIGGAGGFGRGQEGSVYNSATSLMNQSVGGAGWGARLGGNMYRPLAVYRKDIAKQRTTSVHSDSIGSPIDSFVAKILNNAGIANINIGSGGESQRNYPTNTTGRFRVVQYSKTALVEHGRNSFGSGLTVAQNATLALYAQLRAAGVTRIVQTTIGAMTTRIDTGNPSYDTDNQNTESNGIRINFNIWLRSIVGTPTGPDKLWDVEPIITTPDLLKWPNGYTTDGLHPTGTAVNAVVAVATAENWQADIL